MHIPTGDGVWVTPPWLDVDRLLLDLYREWESTLCPGCGEPLSSHAGKTYRDYSAVSVVCPAVIALDKAQTQQAKKDGNREAKEQPARARSWVHGTRDWARTYAAGMRALLTKGGDSG